jgi:hypothetical protein
LILVLECGVKDQTADTFFSYEDEEDKIPVPFLQHPTKLKRS